VERNVINPWTWQDQFGFVQANQVSAVDQVLMCSGQTSMDDDGNPLHRGDMVAQASKAVDNLETVLADSGFALADVVRLNYFVADVDVFFVAAEVFGPHLGQAGCRPASTLLGVSRLAFPELMVEIGATAVK
jgi:enamine deaminase RidA (YjgF/YER057c/UK114 family)